MARLLRQFRPPAWLIRWRWHCLGLAFLVMELAFLAWVLMRQPSPPEPPLLPAESIGITPAATGTPSPSPAGPLPRLNPATPQLFIPTLAGRATPARPTLTPPATATPAPILPTLAATPAATVETPPAPPTTTPIQPPMPTATPPAAPTPFPTATLTPAPAATPTPPPPIPIPPLTAGIALLPDSDTVAVGRQFQLRIWVYCGESNPVDAVQVYLVFDPARFAALSLTAGPDLEIPLQSNVDNALGRLDYAAGTLGAAVTNPFILATATFRALAPTGPPGTYITFAALQAPRQTKAIAGGANLTGNLTSAYMVVE